MPEILIEVDEPDLKFIDQIAAKEKRSRRAQVSKILEEYVQMERAEGAKA